MTTVFDLRNVFQLVIDRFDRIDRTGRRAVMTLAAASGRVDGSWTDAGEELERRGELSGDDSRHVALLDAYGALIANTDRHQYNVLLFPTETGYAVAAAFDQLPMAYAPPASGNLRNSAINEPRPTVNTLQVWDDARTLADEFWSRAADRHLSESMQAIVREHSAR